MPWYLYIALKQLFPTGRRFPFFTAISVLGVALGVALLVVTTSVMGGFGYEIRKMIVDTQGDVQVRSARGSSAIGDWHALSQVIDKVPGVTGSTPFGEGPAVFMLENNPNPAFPLLHGIDVDTVTKVVPFDKYLTQGSLDDLDDDSVILSYQLAANMGAKVGDDVEVYSLAILQGIPKDEVFLPRKLRVVGLFEIGHQQLDSSLVIVTLRRMQDLFNLGNAVNGLNVKIAPGADADEVAAAINAAMPAAAAARAISWSELNQDFLWVLQLEHNMIFFLLTFIIVVAAFSVTSSLLISVVRKTREIGLFGALGGESRQVALCFCFQGFFIGLVGTACGLGLGFAVLAVREPAIHLFTQLTQSQAVLMRFYQFSNLPSHPSLGDITAIVVCSIVISTLAGLLPAWRAARLKPVEALRSE